MCGWLEDRTSAALLLLSLCVPAPAAAGASRTVTDAAELAVAVAQAVDSAGVILELQPGDYHLSATPYVDAACGNCENPDQPVPASLGLRIRGREMVIRGVDRERVRIHTHAGYGLLFEDCLDCRLENVTVTGGIRDTSARATDAAIVVRRSTVSITGCRLADNLGDSAVVAQTVVGIMGVCGREGSDITIRDCEISRNSWDGIALYRDAHATITGCTVDGVDAGRGGPASGGRGVGIGLTWNARADVEANWIRRYWKGVGVFVDAEARVRRNVVEEMRTWGITLWDAGRGTPFAEIVDNAVHRTGACGISVTRGRPGGRTGSRITGNALVRTGGDPRYDADDAYCYQRALAVHERTDGMVIDGNLRFANREAGGKPGRTDLAHAEFRASARGLIERLADEPATRASDFYREFRSPPKARGALSQLGADLEAAGSAVLSDGLHIYSSPARIDRRDAIWLGAMAAVGGLIYAYDQEIHDALDRNRDHELYRPFRRLGEALEPVGHMGNMNRYYFGTLAVSYVLGFRFLTGLSAEILEAHFLAGGVKNLSMAVVGRQRPRDSDGPREFSDGTSFPSGHVINIFELARIFSHHVDFWPAQIAFYGCATAVGFQRVTDHQHWPSDVYVGALLGTTVATTLLNRHDERRLQVTPMLSGGGMGCGLMLTHHF